MKHMWNSEEAGSRGEQGTGVYIAHVCRAKKRGEKKLRRECRQDRLGGTQCLELEDSKSKGKGLQDSSDTSPVGLEDSSNEEEEEETELRLTESKMLFSSGVTNMDSIKKKHIRETTRGLDGAVLGVKVVVGGVCIGRRMWWM